MVNAYLETLITWCEINSGSYHPKGLKAMQQALLTAFSPLCDEVSHLSGYPTEALPTPISSLLFRIRPQVKRRVLLCGHFDTVFGATSPFQKVRRLSDKQYNGPGITDMKGGLMVMYMALTAFEQLPVAKQLGIDIFMNPDEEIGSFSSSPHFKAITQGIPIAFVYEPALDASGTLSRARKGSGHFTITATGQAAHAGRHFEKGRNAIILLARALEKIDALNGQKPGLTLNTGLIEGGTVLNQVPSHAIATLEIRFTKTDDATWAEKEIRALCTAHSQPDASLTVQGHFHRPLKIITPQTQALFTHAQNIASTLSLPLNWQDTGGCCDGNNLADLGLAVLDTLGVSGGDLHTEKEYLCVESLSERAKFSTHLLESLAKGALPELLP